MSENGYAITLIKPQFECENKNIGKSGIVHTSAHAEIVKRVLGYAKESGLYPYAITNAPIRKGKNVEFVALWKKTAGGMKEYEVLLAVKDLLNKHSLNELQ